jgi:tetratricopeptide (TPR) repeat protein
MRTNRALIALCATAVAACATTPGAVAPTAPPPDIACSVQPIQPSEHGSVAQAAIDRTIVLSDAAAQPFYQRALDAAELGMAEQPENPWLYILAGQAAAGLGQVQTAHRYLERAEAMCPEALADEILPARQHAWVIAMDRGVERLRAEDQDAAIRMWEEAAMIWPEGPDAHFNLGVVHATRGEMTVASRHYLRALEVVEALEPTADEEAAMGRQTMRAQVISGLLAIGGQHFRSDQLDDAARVFRRLTEIEPNSRDAWSNLALVLYRQQRWQELLPVAERLVAMDPLNHDARIILASAHRGIAAAAGQQTQAQRDATAQRILAVLQAAEAMPAHITAIGIGGGDGVEPVQIQGEVTGTGQAGGPITMEFVVFGASGELGRASTTIPRPAREQTAPFAVTIPTDEPVTGWRYEVR